MILKRINFFSSWTGKEHCRREFAAVSSLRLWSTCCAYRANFITCYILKLCYKAANVLLLYKTIKNCRPVFYFLCVMIRPESDYRWTKYYKQIVKLNNSLGLIENVVDECLLWIQNGDDHQSLWESLPYSWGRASASAIAATHWRSRDL